MKKKLYLAGPMSGYPNHNFAAFNRAAAKLRAEGYYVFNPAENELPAKFEQGDLFKNGGCPPELYRQLLTDDINFILKEADAIALLPGWTKSKGARAEHAVSVAIGLEVIFLDTNDNVRLSYAAGDEQAALYA